MQVQVEPAHYDFLRYVRKDRMLNYWYQLRLIHTAQPKTVLEIGPGDQTVTTLLRKSGMVVTTVDIDPRLKPDIVSSVDRISVPDASYDLVLCSEVLEHLPFDRFENCLRELLRVSRSAVVVGLPHAGGVVNLAFKIPLVPRIDIFFKIPFFWQTHIFNGEHYWELGKRGYSVSRIKSSIEKVGFRIVGAEIHADDPAHYLFYLRKS